MDINYFLSNASKYNEAKPGPKITVNFKTLNGMIKAFIFCYGTTIDKILNKFILTYLPDYMPSKRIDFLYGLKHLRFGDQTPVEKYFNYYPNPFIEVYD